jgi:hypothetical protein
VVAPGRFESIFGFVSWKGWTFVGDAAIDAGAAGSGDEVAPISPLAYATFSPKLAPGLTAIGGVLAVLGGLGAWIYASRTVTEGLAAERAATTMGYSEPAGIVIAVLGAVAIGGAFIWSTRWLIPKLVPIVGTIALVTLIAMKLTEIDRDAAALADQIRNGSLGFYTYHAGFGWGAWSLLAAAVAIVLGSIVGILRELDVRKGNK